MVTASHLNQQNTAWHVRMSHPGSSKLKAAGPPRGLQLHGINYITRDGSVGIITQIIILLLKLKIWDIDRELKPLRVADCVNRLPQSSAQQMENGDENSQNYVT